LGLTSSLKERDIEGPSNGETDRDKHTHIERKRVRERETKREINDFECLISVRVCALW